MFKSNLKGYGCNKRKNSKVRLQTGHREWISAKMAQETKYPKSVIVETNAGRKYRRNSHRLHKANVGIKTTDVNLENFNRMMEKNNHMNHLNN